MTDYSKITALYSRLSVGDEDRDGGESNSIQNQKIFLENYARGQHLTNIRHYIDDDESGRFFDRSAYSRMMDDVENGKIGVCIMKDLTRWGRDYSTGQPRRGQDHLCPTPCRRLHHRGNAAGNETLAAIPSHLPDRRGRFGRYRQAPPYGSRSRP